MFRDLTDFVMDFPFGSYNEHVNSFHGDDIDTPDRDYKNLIRLVDNGCLPPVPIIYWHNDARGIEER